MLSKQAILLTADIDECSGVNDCQQQCNNTEGSYNCYCRDGFVLNSDGKNCIGM